MGAGASLLRDELVRDEALRLERHYAYHVCGPSRASLMTGRVPPRAGVQLDDGGWTSAFGPPTEMAMLPRRLRASPPAPRRVLRAAGEPSARTSRA